MHPLLLAALLGATSALGRADRVQRAAAARAAPRGLDFPLPPLRARAPLALLSNVFGEHMVFQESAPIVLWGFAPAGASVDVSFGAARGSAVATAAGTWRATLPPAPAGGPYALSAVSAAAAVHLVDVFVGTVLVCSGQSNLSGDTTPVSYVFNGTATAAEAALFPNIRLFRVGEQGVPGESAPLAQLGFPPRLPWSVASPAAVAGFSATCFMTAKALARAQGGAVAAGGALGLIETAWSGTCIQAWLPPAALAQCGPAPRAQPPMDANSTLFDQLVAPFDGFTAAGIVWYQGESNAIFAPSAAAAAAYYACALPALLASWRAFWRAPGAWVGVVQLAPWSGAAAGNEPTAAVRDAQRAVVLADARATLATAVDLGDADAPKTSIHPRVKQELGRRLAAGAAWHLWRAGAARDGAGPVYARAAAGPPGALAATVFFAPPFDAPGALALGGRAAWPGVAPTTACPPGAACAGFAIQDAAGAWHAANASLAPAGGVALVAADGAAGAPRATAYAWALWPLTSLWAADAGALPAYPWRENVTA